MEQVLYVVVGAVLAMFGGFISHHYRSKLDREKADRELMYEVLLLFDKTPFPEEKLRKEFSKNFKKGLTPKEMQVCKKFQSLLVEITHIALKIRSRKYRKLSLMLTHFALDDIFRSDDKCYEIRRCIHMSMNKSMIELYEKEMNSIQKQAQRIVNEHDLQKRN